MRTRLTQTFPNQLVGLGITLPQRNRDYRVISAFVILQTSAVAGNRVPALGLFDGAVGNIMAIYGLTIVASKQVKITYAFGVGLQYNVDNQSQTIPIPEEIWVRPQWNLILTVDNADVGDQFIAPSVQTEILDLPPGKAKGQPAPPQEAPQ